MALVSGLEAARAALSMGERVLESPPYAGCHAGVNYYLALLKQLNAEFPDVEFAFTLSCGDDAAIAHDALRLGIRRVRCDCSEKQWQELRQMAEKCNAELVR
ncbi:MAG: hypothetical protein ACOYNL_03670 [Rickettsiales bacterium]